MALSSISRACVASRVRGTHFSRGLSPLSPKAPMVHQCRLRFQPTWLGPARRGAMEGLSRRFQANGGVRPSPPEFTRNTEETKWTSHFSLLKIYKDSWTRAETSVTSLSQSSLYFSNDSCDQRQEVQHLLWWLPHRTFQNPGQSDQADGVSSAPRGRLFSSHSSGVLLPRLCQAPVAPLLGPLKRHSSLSSEGRTRGGCCSQSNLSG